MRRVSLALVAALLGCAAAGTTLTVAGVNGPPPGQREIVRLLEQAIEKVERDRACRVPPPRTTFSDDPPSSRFLATLGVLRRPANEADRVPDDALRHVAIEGIYRGYVRVARSAGGRDFLVVPARDIDSSITRPARCAAELRRRFGRLIRAKPERFKHRARRVLRQVIRFGFNSPARKPVEGLFLFERDSEGRPASGGSVSLNARSGVEGMVPDSVARVTATFPRVVRHRGDRNPRRYRSRVTRSALVRDNVFAFVVPRAPEDAFPSRVVWRAADGRVLKVVRFPG
jgi:hypothetical protein